MLDDRIIYLRNSVTVGAVLAVAAGLGVQNANSAIAPDPLAFRAVNPGDIRAAFEPDAEPLARALVERRRQSEIAKPPLSPFGQRLLALRNAAIAAGMPTRPADELIEEFRAARNA